eukprot:187948-Prymnesium_polylepis.1
MCDQGSLSDRLGLCRCWGLPSSSCFWSPPAPSETLTDRVSKHTSDKCPPPGRYLNQVRVAGVSHGRRCWVGAPVHPDPSVPGCEKKAQP